MGGPYEQVVVEGQASSGSSSFKQKKKKKKMEKKKKKKFLIEMTVVIYLRHSCSTGTGSAKYFRGPPTH